MDGTGTPGLAGILAPGLVAITLTTGGCQLQHLEADLVDASLDAALGGRVDAPGWDGASPIRVAVYVQPAQEGEPIRVIRFLTLEEPGVWAFVLEPGEYHVAAFVDLDRNEKIGEAEPVAVLDAPVTLRPSNERLDLRLVVERPVDRDVLTGGRDVVEELPLRVGDVVPLDDDRFSHEAGVAGVWRPRDTAGQYPPGLYLLEDHDPDRTPVVLVHGMSGCAQEFTALIDGLDRARFEPWVFQYPSAYPLRIVATALHRAVTQLAFRHDVERMCWVAHSMGGLVARRALRWRADEDPPLVRGLVTLASPLGGMDSAGAGVDMSPVVVPSWRDLVPDGPFLGEQYDRPLPTGTEYHLLFTYLDQGASDGTVLLRSQLRPEAQAEADVVRGFPTSHVGVLIHPDALAQVWVALDRCRGDRPDAPRVAPRPSLAEDGD